MATAAFPILFIAPTGRTDAILASGLLKRLLDEVQTARITVVAGEDEAPLFRETPRLDDLIVTNGRAGLAETFRLWLRLRDRRWGLTLDAVGNDVVKLLRARRRSVARPLAAAAEHKVVQAARLLKLEAEPPAPFLFTSPETRARAAELIGAGGPVLAMAPVVSWVGSAWPLERFARIAVQLLGEGGPLAGGRLLVVGAPDDWWEAELLRRSVLRDQWIDLSRELDPLVICACLAQARLFIGGHGWLTHLAAAAGTPTIGVYGPVDETIEGPWGEHARTVRGPRSFEAIRAIDPHLNQPVCHMLDLPTETVLQAALDLLHGTAPPETIPPPIPSSEPARSAEQASPERRRRHG